MVKNIKLKKAWKKLDRIYYKVNTFDRIINQVLINICVELKIEESRS